MAAQNHVENPFEYVIERLSWAGSDLHRALFARPQPHAAAAPPAVRRIEPEDVGYALREGAADLGAVRDDVVFIAVIYPLAGLVLAAAAFRYDFLPMIFPLASGFALIGPLAAIGLYEISRQREQGHAVSWLTAFHVLRAPNIGSVIGLGLILLVLFFAWLAAAYGIYALTLGPAPPTSIRGFAHDVLLTPRGWAMTAIGVAVGFVFAAFALAISVVSFPLLLDRDIGLGEAVSTSFRAIRENPKVMAMWGVIVAGALVAGAIPGLVGLIFVVPLLGHATWRLYRRVIAPAG